MKLQFISQRLKKIGQTVNLVVDAQVHGGYLSPNRH
jgi:hypothetical protein